MNAIYDGHPITVFIIIAAMMTTPFHILATYAFSAADVRKGALLGALWLVFGALMTLVCMWGVPSRLGMPGNLVVPAAWILPSALLIAFRKWALAQPLSQRWLIGLQLWRAIGAVFLIEMSRGHVPSVFAWPAGLGDVFAALVAFVVLMVFARSPKIPAFGILLVAFVGIADFLSAFFFGFTSGEGPQNLFPQDTPSRLIEFPTGMIPLFLVPYAIFFHTLSLLSLRGSRNAERSTNQTLP